MDFSHEEAPLGSGSDVRMAPMEEASLEEARRLLTFLDESMGALRNAHDPRAQLDEAYRAAHSLKGELDQAAMPGVVRIARLVQEVVRAVRAGRIPAGAEVGSLLSFAARSALDSLEAHARGAQDSGACESSARTLETLLAQPGHPGEAQGLGAPVALQLAKVDAGRLRAVQAASNESGAAASLVARAAEESLALVAGLRGLVAQQERGTRELLDAIPAALAAAARGQPTTGLAGELSGRVAAWGRIASEFEESFTRFTTRLREAAQKGERASAAAREAAARIGRVRLSALFRGFPRLVRGYARRLSYPVESVMDLRDLDLDAALADTVARTVNRCARLVLQSEARKSRSTGNKSDVRAGTFQLQAAVEGTELRVSLRYQGRPTSREKLAEALSDMGARLGRKGILFQMDAEDADNVGLSWKVPCAPGQGNLGGSFILGRAGESLYAVSVSEVVKCIVAPPAEQDYLLGNEKLPVRPMAGAGTPRAGVVVAAGGMKGVLLFDKLEGEEKLAPAPIDYPGARTPGITAAAARADGGVALVIDVASYLSAQRESSAGSTSGSRKRKR